MNQELKNQWIATMQAHQDADRLVQGTWWSPETFTGCFFGCAMQTQESAVEKAAIAMQLPSWLLHYAEILFEDLPVKEALAFPVEMLKAIPVDSTFTNLLKTLIISSLTSLVAPEDEEVLQLVIDCMEFPTEENVSKAEAILADAPSDFDQLALRLVRDLSLDSLLDLHTCQVWAHELSSIDTKDRFLELLAEAKV